MINNSNAETTVKHPETDKSNNQFFDPLLECLVILTQLNGKPYSGHSLVDGLPLVKHKLTPTLLTRAAERAGLQANIQKRTLNTITQLLLPAIILLSNNQACILHKINATNAEIILPEVGASTKTIALKELEEQYTGFTIFIQPILQFEQRANEFKIDRPHSWFWGTLWRYRHNYYQVFLAAILINIFAIVSPLFTMNVYDRVVPNSAIETLWVLASGVCLVFIFDFILRTLRSYLVDFTGKKADMRFASMIFAQILNMRMEYKPISAGGFANNLNGYESLRDFFTSATLCALIDLPFVLFFILIIFIIGGPIAIVPLAAIPIVIIAGFLFEVPIRRAIEQSYFGTTQKQALLIESLIALETIKTQSAISVKQKKWEDFVAIVAKASLKSRFFSAMAMNFSYYVTQMVTIITIIVGVYLISENNLTTGGLIACTILCGRALAPLSQIAAYITKFQQSKLGLEALNKVMSLPVERPANSHFLHRPKLLGNIDLVNVNFSYPEQLINALSSINIKVNAGEHVAIIGRIGSGKTTLLKLISGLYLPSEGSIRHDGTDIRQIDPADLKRNIGYVSQDAMLFYGSVKQNISTTAPWASDEQILTAAKIANVDNFVRRHPFGYDMIIGEGGQGLSGGQRQTIAIARAILNDPAIYLFDEPTSAMDNSSEREFIQNIAKITANKTLVIVTHKPQMLALVNRIIIMDNGIIVADGPKDKVLHALSNNAVKTAES